MGRHTSGLEEDLARTKGLLGGRMEEVRGLARGGIRGLSPGQEELSLMEKDLNTAWLFSITSTM